MIYGTRVDGAKSKEMIMPKLGPTSVTCEPTAGGEQGLKQLYIVQHRQYTAITV